MKEIEMTIAFDLTDPGPIPDAVFWYRSDTDKVRLRVDGETRDWMTGAEFAEWMSALRYSLDEDDEE